MYRKKLQKNAESHLCYVLSWNNIAVPCRTNAFQELVTLIELQMAPRGAAIVAPALLGDPPREIDILLKVPAGEHDVLIGIECVDRKRRASVEWVEQILAKHGSIGVHKSVLVSRRGFSKEALRLARTQGADALSFKEAKAANWKTVTEKMIMSFVVRDRIEAVYVEFQSGSLNYPSQIDFDHALYYIDGKPVGPLREIVFKLQDSPDVDRNLYMAARDGGEGSIDLVWVFEDGEYLVDQQGNHHPLLLLVEVLCGHVENRNLPVQQAEYAGKLVTFAATEEGDTKFKAVLVEKPNGSVSMLTSSSGSDTLLGHEIDSVVSMPPRLVSDHERRLRQVWEEFLEKRSSETNGLPIYNVQR